LNDQLTEILSPNSKIETVLLTSGNLAGLNLRLNGNLNINNGITTLKGFVQILIDNQIKFEISGDVTGNGQYHPFTNNGIQAAVAQQNGHIIWWLKVSNKKIRIINLPSPAGNASINIPASPFFFRWVNWKALQNQIPLPLAGQNLMNEYLPLHDIFNPPYTSQYKMEVYSLVLNNLITLQAI